MNLIERVKVPVPKFFRVLRNAGLIMAAAGASILASSVSLPAAIVTFGGYLTVGCSVFGAISQATVEGEESTTKSTGGNGESS
jgi:hypothetical protein